MICKKGLVGLMGSPQNGTRKGKKYESRSSFQSTLPQQHIGATNPAQPSPFLFISSQNLKCTLHFKWKACLRKNYLLGNVNQRRSSKQSKGVQGDNDHLGGGVGCHQLLQQLPGAGGQARIVVHVLQNRDQLQLQVHRCGQTYNKERNTGRISPWAGFFWQF